MDGNRFFRDATTRICGDLDIEHALHASLLYLRQFLPLDRTFLQLYEPGLGVMRTIAMARATEGRQVDLLTPLPNRCATGYEAHLPPIRGSASTA